jgi:hypothetical protein
MTARAPLTPSDVERWQCAEGVVGELSRALATAWSEVERLRAALGRWRNEHSHHDCAACDVLRAALAGKGTP